VAYTLQIFKPIQYDCNISSTNTTFPRLYHPNWILRMLQKTKLLAM